MKKSLFVLSTVLIAGSLVLSACSNNNAGNTASSGNSSNGASNSSSNNSSAPALTEAIQASDLSKLPTTAKNRTDTIIVALTDPSGAFTPYFWQSGYDGNVTNLLNAPLVRTDEQGVPQPELAESWDISDDQLTYTFHLRKDTTFSDGSPLTADDVAFTWTILHDKAYDGDVQIGDLHIKGGADYKAGKATSIEGIKVIDPLTISVTLEQPNATAVLMLGGDVLSKAYYGKDYQFGKLDYIKDLNSKPLGNGPYVLEKFIPGQEVRFVANERYFKGKPKTEHFIYKTTQGDVWQFLETGEIDFSNSFTATTDNINKLKSLGFVNIVPFTPSNYGYMQVNLEHEALQDKRVRQALTYGLDRKTIYVDANQGAGAVANIPSTQNSWSYTEEGINPYEFNTDKANQLLDEAGWTLGSDGIRQKDGKKLTIHYLGSKSTQTDIFIPVATENYKAIGVDFQPEVFADYNSLASKVDSGDYDLVSFSTSLINDPSDGFMQFFNGEVKGYNNPQFTELYNKGLATTDLEQRKQVYHELDKLLNDELPVIFTNYRKSVYAYNGRIGDLTYSPSNGIAPGIANWNLE